MTWVVEVKELLKFASVDCIKTSIGSESCLPFISFFHLDIIKAPSDIEFSEVLSPLQFINELGDEG